MERDRESTLSVEVDSRAAAGRPSWALMVSVFAVAMAVLGFEVALTRAFSVLLRFHFVFLAISLATCGLGVGGLVDFLLRRTVLRSVPPPLLLVVSGTLCGVLIPLTVHLLFNTSLSAQLTSVWVVTGICLPPFLAAGAFLSHAFAWHSGQGGRLYFADLIGAALGSFLVIGALQMLGGINAAMIWGAVVAAGCACLGIQERRAAWTAGPVVVTVLVVALVFANRGGAIIDVPIMPLASDWNAKPLFQELGDPSIGAKIVDTEWNAFARTDVVSNEGTDDLFIYTDGEVPTNMIPFDGDMQAILPRLTSFIGFYAFYQVKPESVLLIGPGGGLDVLLSMAVDAKKIDGAELNPSIPRLVRKYGEMNGHIYDIEGVNIRVDEGRSFVNRSEDEYDLIYMALTKTATTTTSSLALLESYVHTTEAFEQYFEHLTDRGAVGFVCQSPLILLRTMLTAVAALETRGIDRATALKHVALMSVPPNVMQAVGPYRYLLLAGKQPFELSRSIDFAKQSVGMGLEPIYFPGAFEPEPFKSLTGKVLSDRDFIALWNRMYPSPEPVEFGACPDDRPFVVDMSVGVPPQFGRFLWVAILLVPALCVSVIAWLRSVAPAQFPGVGKLAGAALYFCLLGTGFMVVEVVLAQKLTLYLGYPVLTLSVILFSLLLGGGMGSLFSQRWAAGGGLALRACIATLIVALASYALYLLQPALVENTLAWDIRLRCAMTMAMLMPLGFVMGMPFPTGIRIVGDWSPDLVPWMWGLNGVTSVVGSVATMVLAKLFGFGIVLVIGTLIYVAAAGIAALGHRAGADSS